MDSFEELKLFQYKLLPDALTVKEVKEQVNSIENIIDHDLTVSDQQVYEVMTLVIEIWCDFVLPYQKYSCLLEKIAGIDHVSDEDRLLDWADQFSLF